MPSAPLRVPFITDGFTRSLGTPVGLPVNLVSEATPLREPVAGAAQAGFRDIHYGRPGLMAGTTIGTGPIRGIANGPPAFGEGYFYVTGQSIRQAGGFIRGTVTGSDRVRFAVSRSQMVVVADGVAYLYDGTGASLGFKPILAMPGNVTDVAYLAGRFVYAMRDTDQFYYSEINDGANIPGLNFATAESFADPIVGMGVLNEEIVFFGQTSVEFWATSTDPFAPFAPTLGRGFQRGCVSRDSIAFADNDLFWVADNNVVYRAQNTPTRVSSSSIEDKIGQCAAKGSISAFSATFQGHEFYVINLPGVGSYAYDASRVGTATGAYGSSYGRGEWAEWASFGRDHFRVQCAATIGGVTYAGDDTTSDLWRLTPGVFSDGADTIARVASAFIPVEARTPRCNAIVLHAVVGVGNAVFPGKDPVVELRYSDDAGRTFGEWRPAALGRQGDYRARAYWQRLGSMRAPGRLVEVRCAEKVSVVFSHLTVNDPRPAQ